MMDQNFLLHLLFLKNSNPKLLPRYESMVLTFNIAFHVPVLSTGGLYVAFIGRILKSGLPHFILQVHALIISENCQQMARPSFPEEGGSLNSI